MKLRNNKWTTDDGRLIVTCRGNIGTILSFAVARTGRQGIGSVRTVMRCGLGGRPKRPLTPVTTPVKIFTEGTYGT